MARSYKRAILLLLSFKPLQPNLNPESENHPKTSPESTRPTEGSSICANFSTQITRGNESGGYLKLPSFCLVNSVSLRLLL